VRGIASVAVAVLNADGCHTEASARGTFAARVITNESIAIVKSANAESPGVRQGELMRIAVEFPRKIIKSRILRNNRRGDGGVVSCKVMWCVGFRRVLRRRVGELLRIWMFLVFQDVREVHLRERGRYGRRWVDGSRRSEDGSAQFRHEFEQDVADELLDFIAGERVTYQPGSFSRSSGAASASALLEQPRGGAPAFFAGHGDLAGGAGLTDEACLPNAFGQFRVSLNRMLDGSRRNADDPGCLTFGDAEMQKIAVLHAFGVVEAHLRARAGGLLVARAVLIASWRVGAASGHVRRGRAVDRRRNGERLGWDAEMVLVEGGRFGKHGASEDRVGRGATCIRMYTIRWRRCQGGALGIVSGGARAHPSSQRSSN